MNAIGRLRISPADIGRRVSVRHFDGAELTDVLGHLISWDSDWPKGVLSLRKKDNSVVQITSGAIFAAKVIEPEIGALDLERDSESTWVPQETQELGDWVLRFSGNESARANSCRLDGRPFEDVDASLQKIISWYREKKAAPIVQTPKPGAFDEALKRNNFVEFVHALYMIAPATRSENAEVMIEKELTEQWFETALKSDARAPKLSKELLLSGSFVRFASILDERKNIIATGRVSASENIAMVTTVWVEAQYRKTGLAKKIMNALSNEIAELGHKIIVLQVLKSNEAAVSLYQNLGYEIHHDYAYHRYTKQNLTNDQDKN
jgi:predicted GNAT family acetyltransferase